MHMDPFAFSNPWQNPQSYGSLGLGQLQTTPWQQGIYGQAGGLQTLQPQTWFGAPGAFGANPVLQQIPYLLQQAQQIAQTAPQLAQQIPQLVQQNPQLAQQAPQLQHIPQILHQAAQLAQQVPQLVQQALATTAGSSGYGSPYGQQFGFGQSPLGMSGGFGRMF